MKVKLTHVMPGPAFQIVESPGDTYWQVVILDEESEDLVHFECRNRRATLDDVVKAGGRECSDNRGWVKVVHVVDGVPILCRTFQVSYAWDMWYIWEVA